MINNEKIWMALPGEVDQWWRDRSQMNLVENGGRWRIEGPGAENARIAFAVRKGDSLFYEVTSASDHERIS